MNAKNYVFYSQFSGNWSAMNINGEHRVFNNQQDAEDFAGPGFEKQNY